MQTERREGKYYYVPQFWIYSREGSDYTVEKYMDMGQFIFYRTDNSILIYELQYKNALLGSSLMV